MVSPAPKLGLVPPCHHPEEQEAKVPPRVMRAAEVAAMLALPKRTVYDLAKAGRMPSYGVAGRVMFIESEVWAWFLAQRRGERKGGRPRGNDAR